MTENSGEQDFAKALEIGFKLKEFYDREPTQTQINESICEYCNISNISELEPIKIVQEDARSEAEMRLLHPIRPAFVKVQASKPMWDSIVNDPRAKAHFQRQANADFDRLNRR